MDLIALNNDYLTVFPGTRAISVYESAHYDYFDMDFLGPSQRRYLMSKAQKLGFIQKSGKWMEAPDKTKIFFPGQKLFNRSFKSFLPDTQDELTWLAVTPTQAAFLLLRDPTLDEQDLYHLMMHQPFNLRRLGQAVEHESFFGRFQSLYPELERLYKRAQLLLKEKLPLEKVHRS
jgi:hypothetical protein